MHLRSEMLTIVAFACGWMSPLSASAASHPNVLFFAVDDMRDWVNCLGGCNGTVHTHNIDRLAKRGMLFTNAHCASPKCAPSRTAIMAGVLAENRHAEQVRTTPDLVAFWDFQGDAGQARASKGGGKVYALDMFEDTQEVARGLAAQAAAGLEEAVAEQIIS